MAWSCIFPKRRDSLWFHGDPRHRRSLSWSLVSKATGRAQKIALPRNNLPRDIRNGLLALVDRSDQEFAAPGLVADVIFDVSAVVVLRDNVLVEKAVDEHAPWLPELKLEPTYDPFRSDPCFIALVKRVGLEK